MSFPYYRRVPLFVPYDGKIADITEADTNKHFLTLANAAGTGAIAGETRKIVAVQVVAIRVSGTGSLKVNPNEGAFDITVSLSYLLGFTVIAEGTNRLQYFQSVANDDFDLYCFGYVVES